MAKLAAVYDTMAAVPEGQKGFYVEKDGKAVLDTDVRDHPEAHGLKSALDKERTSREDAEKRLKAIGATAEEVAEFRRKAEAAEKKSKDKDKDVDGDTIARLEAEYKAKLEAETAPERAARQAAESELYAERLDNQLRAVASASGVMGGRMEDALQLNRVRFKLGEDKRSLVVIDAKGNPEAMTPQKYWLEYQKTERPWLYAGSGASGSGAQRSTAIAGAKTAHIGDNESFLANIDGLANGSVRPI